MSTKNTIPDNMPIDQVVNIFRQDIQQDNSVNHKLSAKEAQREKVKQSLSAEQPKQSPTSLNNVQQQEIGVPMSVSISDVLYFEGNPRTYHFPEDYNNIKESIRTEGILMPVHITQRPKDNGKFVLVAGGNTRLKILNELYQETGDPKFSVIPSLFVAYSSYGDMKRKHLRENVLRGQLCFFDHAKYIVDSMQDYQNEFGKTPSIRELEDYLEIVISSKYYSRTEIAAMIFAFNKLKSLKVHAYYLTRTNAEDIRKLYNQLIEIEQIKQGGEAYFEEIFDKTLSEWADLHLEYDDLNINSLLVYLKENIIKKYQLDLHLVSETIEQKQKTKKEKKQKSEKINQEPENFVHTPNDMGDEENDTNTENSSVDEFNDSALTFSKAEAIEQIHHYVMSLLNHIRFPELFKKHDAFKYGFYIEMPSEEMVDKYRQLALQAENSALTDEFIHPEAINIFWFLVELSGQNDDIDDQSAPVYLLSPESPFFKFTQYSDSTNTLFGYEPPYGFKPLIQYICSDQYIEIKEALYGLFNVTALYQSLEK